MGSGGIVRDLRGISRLSRTWERIYCFFPSVIPFGGLVLVPNLGNNSRRKKGGTPKLIDPKTVPEIKAHKTEAR